VFFYCCGASKCFSTVVVLSSAWYLFSFVLFFVCCLFLSFLFYDILRCRLIRFFGFAYFGCFGFACFSSFCCFVNIYLLCGAVNYRVLFCVVVAI